MSTEQGQPSKVTTEETPRAPDEHVVTSDAPPAEPQGEAGSSDSSAAAAPSGTKPSDPASDNAQQAQSRRQRNRAAERKVAALAKKLADAEAQKAADAMRIAELEQTVGSLKAATPKPKEPNFDDYRGDHRRYAKDYAKWEAGNAETPAATPAPRRATPAATPAAPEPASPPTVGDKVIADFQSRVKQKLGSVGEEALEAEGVGISGPMADWLSDPANEVGPDVYAYLALEDPDFSRVLYASPKADAIKELEKLAAKAKKGELVEYDEGELRVAPLPGDDDATPPKKASRAPTPPSDTRPGNVSLPANPDTESMDDYAARRAKEEARRRGYIT